MNAAALLVEVRVPDMGSFKDVAIIDVLVKPGETIEVESPLVTLETEKATMDVPSTVAGVIEKIHIAKGGTISPGDLIATVRTEAAPASTGGSSGSGNAAGSPGGNAAGTAPTAGTASAAGTAPAAGNASALGTAPAAGAGTNSGDTRSSTGGQSPTQSGLSAGAAGGQGAAQAGRTGDQAGSGSAGGSGPSTSGMEAGAGASAGSSASLGGSASGAGGAGGRGAGAESSGSSMRGSASSGTSPGGAVAAPDSTKGAAAIRPPFNEPGFSRAHAGPSVRHFARELGVDLTLVTGGGFKGRVTHDDVKAYVKKFLAAGSASGAGASPVAAAARGTGLPTIPVIDFSQFGPVETKPLTRIQKISGPRLHASWVNIPHVTQFDEADVTDLEEVRAKLKDTARQQGIKLTPLAFILRACVRALQEFPVFNSSLDASGANLVLKKYLNVGFAADTPNGLVVPVVRDANRKDVYEIARQLGELSEKARAGKLSPADMQGGCFTISSLGGLGGTGFTPIINAPEVAILGVSKSTLKPVYREGALVPRLILPLSLSYDHRVIDGASAARFITFLAATLGDARGLTEAVP